MIKVIPQGITEVKETDPGRYVWLVQTFEEKYNEKDQRLFFNSQLRCVMPKEREGRFHFENFWIGIDNDPGGNMNDTWENSMGAAKLFSFSIVAGVPFKGQTPEVFKQMILGKQVGGHVERVWNEKNKKHYTNVTKWLAPGTFDPGIEAVVDNSPAPVASPTPVSQGIVQQSPPGVQPQQQLYNPQQAYGQVGQQPANVVAQQQPQQYVQQQPVAQQPIPAQNVAVPGAGAAPLVAQPQQQVQPQAGVAQGQPEEIIACSVCQDMGKGIVNVPDSQIDSHIAAHAAGQIA